MNVAMNESYVFLYAFA